MGEEINPTSRTADIHPVNARINSTAIEAAVQDNQAVEAGTVLVKLDPQDYQVALQQAQAGVPAAQAVITPAIFENT